jgi:UDP-2,3-diacylglucosamine pyrophosphatase LpxH
MAAEKLDRYQRSVAKGLSKAFDQEATEEHELDLDTAKLVVFSDHHKGARDGADDFRRCERAYVAALGYYLEEGHRLYVLGDVEELWENSPDEPLDAYPEALELEAEFHRQGRYERFWGNHDDHWGSPRAVEKRLWRYYPELEVREALKLGIMSNGERLGLLFFVHGHQGTAESQRFAWFSKLVVRYIWRPLQRRFGFSATTPARDWELRAKHNQALFAWARSHPAKPVLIAGHTHKPVFGTSTPPKPKHRPLSDVEAQLADARTKSPVERDKIARLRAELGWIEAIGRSTEPAPMPIEPPCYFNTGCCSFPDGDVTGLEIADGMIRLVRWPDAEDNALPRILVEDDLRGVLVGLRS